MGVEYKINRTNKMFALLVFDSDGEIERYNILHSSLLAQHDENVFIWHNRHKKRNEQPS